MTLKAMGQQKAQAAIQSPKVPGPNPMALTVAIPVTMQDISPDMIRQNIICDSRAWVIGIIRSFTAPSCAIFSQQMPVTGVLARHPSQRVHGAGRRWIVFGADPSVVSAVVDGVEQGGKVDRAIARL